METTTSKTPILVVDNDRWSRSPYVVFSDDAILGYCIPDEWVDEAYYTAQDQGFDGTREEVATGIEEDFFSENSEVDKFWPEHHVLKCGNSYYTYTDKGMCEWVRDESDLPETIKTEDNIND